jgi:hypothetical protein
MGQIFDPLTTALGTASKVRLLRALLPLTRAFTGREASRLAGIPWAPTARALDDLVGLGILERQPVNERLHHYTVNRENHLVRHALPQLFRAEEEWGHAILDAVREELAADEDGQNQRLTRSIALFGNALSRSGKSGQDLDLLVIASSEAASDRIWTILAGLSAKLARRFGVRLVAVVLLLAEFRTRHQAGDPLLQRAVEEAILVSGRSLPELLQRAAG